VGCDIHAFVEFKSGDEWHFYTEIDISRDYDLFEKMAGVRGNSVNAIAEPKGLPLDISKTTYLHTVSWGMDGHSFSYLNFDELTIIEKQFKILDADHKHFHRSDFFFGNDFLVKEDWPEFVSDLRLVFWFDN
jgi:hypothetical protein